MITLEEIKKQVANSIRQSEENGSSSAKNTYILAYAEPIRNNDDIEVWSWRKWSFSAAQFEKLNTAKRIADETRRILPHTYEGLDIDKVTTKVLLELIEKNKFIELLHNPREYAVQLDAPKRTKKQAE